MIPDKIKIGGIVYTVRQDKNETLEQAGNDACIRYLPQEIWMRDYLGPDYKTQCLCHEITHGIFDAIGRSDLRADEVLVSAFGNMLHQVLKDNKLIFGD
jgi:hypothetical protein